MRRFDIVLVEFPFSDLSETKLRPAVVVANPGGVNAILCQVTTRRRSIRKYEVPLPRTHCEGEIRFESNVYVDMLFTLHASLVKRRIGRIALDETCELISRKLLKLFA